MGCEDDDIREGTDGPEAVALACNAARANAQAVLVEHWLIPPGDWRSMRPVAGDVVVAHEGTLWVTIAEDLNDHILRPGEAMPLKAGALTFFGALNREAVRFRVRRPAHPIAKASDAGRCGPPAPLSPCAAPADTRQDGGATARHLDPEFRGRA